MEQAIGRAVRHKQKKHVHIYHFFTSGTIDVDIIELRHKKVLKHKDITSPQELPAYDNSSYWPPYPEFKSYTNELVESPVEAEVRSDYANGCGELIFPPYTAYHE